MLGLNHFGLMDYIVVAATLLLSLAIGVYYAVFGKNTNENLLLGGRSMSTLPIGISIMVSYLSAVTLLGYPAEVYSYGIEIFMMTIVLSIFIPFSAYIFVPVFYDMKLTSIYEYLEMRFESLLIRRLASAIFILQQLLLTGVILYAPAIALEHFLGLPIWVSVIGIGLCGTVYTTIGGLKAVVWTDTFQFLMVLCGLLAIVIRSCIKAGGIFQVFKIAHEHGRLELFNFTFDPFMRHNFFNFLLGQGVYAILQPGTHQLQVQRYSSLPSLAKAKRSIILSVPLKIIVMTLCLITGLAIFAANVGCDPILLGKIKKSDELVPLFVIEELSFIPGMMGLFTACLFSAVLSSVSSSLNSMSACTWKDFISRTKFAERFGEFGQANISRAACFIYGALCSMVALIAPSFGALYTVALSIFGVTNAPLAANFVLGLFMPCINKFGAVVGTLTGIGVMTFISVNSRIIGKSHFPLPTSISECPYEVINSTMTAISYPGVRSRVIEWPDKLYTLSYVLYPCFASLITISVAILVSALTGGCSRHNCRKVKRTMLLHPWLQGNKQWARPSENLLSQINMERIPSQPQVPTGINPKVKRVKSYTYDLVPSNNSQASESAI